MRRQILFSVLLGLLIFSACKKEKTQTSQVNDPPVAKAGEDRSVTLSCNISILLNSFELDGGGSYDNNGNIARYKWTAISGPPGYSIQTPNDKKTVIENPSSGKYEFELTVTDAGGLSSKDTVVITVINLTEQYNLDITINTAYHFYDNVSDPWQYTIDSANFDHTEIVEKVNLSPLGEFDIYVEEYADTAALSDKIYDGYIEISSGHVNPLYIFGHNSINFKKLIRQGGGSFSGSLTLTNGSAIGCRPTIFLNLPPLSVQGTLDVNTHLVTLIIRGKVFF